MSSANPSDPSISATVSASAGTGKTYLLVTRIVRLLLNNTEPENILALTFTRKAAGEMRQRLLARLQTLSMLENVELEQALQGMDVSHDSKTQLLARQLYEKVLFADTPLRISTFHSFCQELLHRFPLEADVPPGYELVETTEIIEDMAWDDLFLKSTQAPNGPTAQALELLFEKCNGLHNTRQALLSGFLSHRSDWWAFTENQPDALKFAEHYLQDLLKPLAKPLNHFFTDAHLSQLKEFMDLLCLHPIKTHLKYAGQIEQALNVQQPLEDRFQTAKQAFLTASLTPMKRKSSKPLETKLGNTGVERFLQLHHQLSEAILETHEQILKSEAYKINQAWYRAGHALLQCYQTIKLEQALLDFADLEWKAYRLLHHPEQAMWVQYKLDQKIDHLLVDEFQDTNPTQWRLILPILEEMASGESDRNRSVFLVGDTKQSIYSFRRAKPQLQRTASDWMSKHLAAQSFPMSKSWRSAPAIMQCLNAVFGESPLGQQLDNYQDHETHLHTSWGQVEILPLVKPDIIEEKTDELILRDPLTEARQKTRTTPYYLEGQQIAKRIQLLVNSNYVVVNNGLKHTIDYGDIFILFRNRTHVAEYEKALNESNIPFIGAEKGTLLDSLEIQDIEALLKVLAMPFDNMACAQLLRSPIFCASDQDLMQLAAYDSSLGSPAWPDRLHAIVEAGHASPALARACKLLSSWREKLIELPIHDLLDRIYFEGDVVNRYRQAVPEHLQNRVAGNLNRMLEIALQISSGRYPSMMRFLTTLGKLRASEDGLFDSPAAADGHTKVKLMTIHAAKGLEAPAVFLADTTRSQTRTEAYHSVVDWPADDARPKHMVFCTKKDQTPKIMLQIKNEQHESQISEQANLLYVAASRARNMLIISGSTDDHNQEDTSSWYSALSTSLLPYAQTTEDDHLLLKSGAPCIADKPIADDHQQTDTYIELDLPTPTQQHLNTPAHSTTPSDTGQAHHDFYSIQRGNFIHKLLEKISHPQPMKAEEFRTDLAANITGDDLVEWTQEAKAVVEDTELYFLFDPQAYSSAYKEVPIAYNTPTGDPIIGVIDRLVVHNDTAWIIDYKTQADAADLEVAPLIARYRNQLSHYAQGIKLLWPDKSIRAALLLTHTAQLVHVPLNDE